MCGTADIMGDIDVVKQESVNFATSVCPASTSMSISRSWYLISPCIVKSGVRCIK